MVVIRPARMADLDHLVALADMATFGLTSLPKDRDLLARRIAQSEFSFQKPWDKPMGEVYIFVMEDRETGTVIGTSCIVSKVGGFEPFYAYKLETSIHKSETLNIVKEIPTLHLLAEHSGPCEIGGLFLDPAYRKHGNGRLLSLFRFLFMQEYPRRFETVVIAEMRGVLDENGLSPFWEAVGRHFFDLDYPKADYLSAKDKRFIAELMPRYPIYVPTLPRAAQEVIGKVHKNTEPALKMLQDEGFTFNGMVDIFEGGPVISCRLEDVRIVKESLKAPLEEILSHVPESGDYIVLKTHEDFRACIGKVALMNTGGIAVDRRTADNLEASLGDSLRFGPIRPGTRNEGSPS
jgi:arginine N-succinyltransferase